MADADDLRRFDIELARVVDRLNGMPLSRAQTATDDCAAAAEYILTSTRQIDPDIPSDATVPRLGPQGLGSLIAVLGRDYRNAAEATPGSVVDPVLDRLVELRRSLP